MPVLRKNLGFSLVEILVIMVVISLIAAIAIPNYTANKLASEQRVLGGLLSGIGSNLELCIQLHKKDARRCDEPHKIGLQKLSRGIEVLAISMRVGAKKTDYKRSTSGVIAKKTTSSAPPTPISINKTDKICFEVTGQGFRGCVDSDGDKHVCKYSTGSSSSPACSTTGECQKGAINSNCSYS